MKYDALGFISAYKVSIYYKHAQTNFTCIHSERNIIMCGEPTKAR